MLALLSITILSALSYSISFVIPQLSYVFFPGLILLMISLFRISEATSTISYVLWLGYLWGIIFFSIHCFWLALLLYHYTSFFTAIVLYGFVANYFTLFAVLLFVLCFFGGKALAERFFIRASLIIFLSIGVLYIFQRYCWLLVGRCEGYPFISPLIPFSRIPGSLYIISIIAQLWTPHQVKVNCDLSNLRAITAYTVSRHITSPIKTCQSLFHDLTSIPKGKKVIVAPESCCSFPLNQYPKLLKLLQGGLKGGQVMLIGGYYTKKKRWYQAIYQLTENSIYLAYKKKHTVFLVEQMPTVLRNFQWLRSLFLNKKYEFTPAVDFQEKLIRISPNWQCSLTLCSELFFCRTIKDFLRYSKNSFRLGTVHILLMNDSWFCAYFTEIMLTVAQLTAALTRNVVMYVGHSGCFLLHPQGNRVVIKVTKKKENYASIHASRC